MERSPHPGRARAEAAAEALMAPALRRQRARRERRLRRRLRWQQLRLAGRRAALPALAATLLCAVLAWCAGIGPEQPLRLLLRCLAWIGLPLFLLLRWRLAGRRRRGGRIIEA